MSLTDEEYALALNLAPKKTTRRPGMWRNVWRRSDGKAHLTLQDGQLLLDEFHFVGRGRYVSHEIAEQKAIEAHRKMSPAAQKLFTWIEARRFT